MLDMTEIRVCTVVDIDAPDWSACRDALCAMVLEMGRQSEVILQGGCGGFRITAFIRR
jgi:hypothetical protein